MKDGLYLVDRGNIYAAFVIRDGKVHSCAPILRNNIDYYMKIAQYVPTEGESIQEQEPEMAAVSGGEEDPPPWRGGVE
jgi:hypothetical protein